MLSIDAYRAVFVEYLEEKTYNNKPTSLYQPINYILKLGGKRLRPLLTLMTTDIFAGDHKHALDAALAIEVFHNFSLIHDDIMDDAPLRRGQATVHEKWDLNTGILSGDAMLILSYQLFESYEHPIFKDLITLFSKTALEVCEGQQYDIDFETRDDVTITEYLKMIEYKTSVLVAAAMKMGAIIAKAEIEDQNGIYEFGRNLGIAFQLQDDFLDAFGDPKTFGKQVGGDIIENKKTYLYLKALKGSNKKQATQLTDLFSIQPASSEEKVTIVKQLFETTGAANATKRAIKTYTEKAFSVLDTLAIDESKKMMLQKFGESLMNRTV
ncbi:polyprenyl synthetase family protein [Spongiivirga sp. MCCC 1A20706]|uniref:polyprenyl synthetase family protein n=1 Tax=Spongiivirga sp. MCCC 1A20706 TaxID=3160963 RepID=UPI0039779727